MANAKHTHTHTQTTLVYIDDLNSTWRIATRTLPFSFLASGQHLYFFPLFILLAPQTTPNIKQAHIRFIDFPLGTRRDDDAYDTRKEKYHFRTTFVLNAYHDGCTRLTTYGICMRGRYHRDREERALSSAFLGWHHGEGGGIPRPWWGLRSPPWDFRPNCPLAEPAATNPSFLLLLPYSVC